MANIHEIPDTQRKRAELRRLVGEFAAVRALVPPFSMEKLESLSNEFIETEALDSALKGWIMVEINNAAWRDTVASVPHERRILLLPQCLSNSKHCCAGNDEMGLLCRRCGNCSINSLEDIAAMFGVMSIVAEGFTAAVSLIKNGIVDAVIGVGCLESLEKAFPLLVAGAVPGVAVSLNGAGCKDTDVDEERVAEMISMLSEESNPPLDYNRLDSTLKEWFSPASLAETILPGGDHTSRVAFEWMSTEGKRWRPYLTAATYLTLGGGNTLPEKVKFAALAVECFHKASLVHDDIQDNDELRYGEKTVHARHGASIAINVGDILLGEGYRLLALCGDSELVKAVAGAHVSLCRGQGAELEWSRSPRHFDMEFVLKIFREKTVPAFEVSLELGAICAGAEEEVRAILHDYSEALGIAYQLRDDLEDFNGRRAVIPRPSAVLAAVLERCTDESLVREIFEAADSEALFAQPECRSLLYAAIERVEKMAADYRSRAFAVLDRLKVPELKRLLFRVTERILK